jgi:hypothetical protein
MASGTKQRMEDLWFSTDRKVPTGSVTEYYSEVSNNAISLAGEVVGPFTLSKDMAYYGNGSMKSRLELKAPSLILYRIWAWLARTELPDDGQRGSRGSDWQY